MGLVRDDPGGGMAYPEGMIASPSRRNLRLALLAFFCLGLARFLAVPPAPASDPPRRERRFAAAQAPTQTTAGPTEGIAVSDLRVDRVRRPAPTPVAHARPVPVVRRWARIRPPAALGPAGYPQASRRAQPQSNTDMDSIGHKPQRPLPAASPEAGGVEAECQADVALSAELSQSELSDSGEPHIVYALLECRPSIGEAPRPPAHLAMVIDVSGSMMHQRKLECAIEACQLAFTLLRPEDSGGVVAFAASAAVVAPLGKGAPKDLGGLVRHAHVMAGTRVLTGMEAGLAELDRMSTPGCTEHMLLLTDGDTKDAEACQSAAEGAGARGVSISTIGLGSDVNAPLLRSIANVTGGCYTFTANALELSSVFDAVVKRAQRPVQRGSRLQLKLGRGVELRHAYRLSPARRDLGSPEGSSDGLRLPLGDLHDRELASVLLELWVPAGGRALVRARVEHDGPDPSRSGSAPMAVAVRYRASGSVPSRRVMDVVDSLARR